MANEYGDCKDKHTLFSSMLTAAGYRGYPALINSSRKIDPDVPSPAQFDHVITFIPMGDETLWADTTAEVAPFRLLMPQLRDKQALIVPINAPARLETTPAEPPFMSTELVEVKAEVNELGQLKGHAHVKMRGDAETAFRFTFRRTPKAQWKDLRYLLARVAGIGGGEASEIKTSDPGNLEQPFEVDFDFTNNTFLDWSTKKSKLDVPMPALKLGAVDPDKEENSKPIPLGAPLDATYRLTLTLPAKYEAAAPLPVSVKRDYAEYSATYKLDGHTLTAERTFHLRRHELEAARVMDYAAFVAATRSDEGQRIAIETSAVAGAPAIADSVTVAELMQAAEAAAGNENYAAAEQLLKRVIAKEPKHKTARVALGEALFYQRKHDEAIAALQEQTKINPFDETAYDLIGEAYWQQRKYAEAETAFRKQLEIAPLNATTHANLGQMLSESRKFKEAVPELEKAISLKPEEDVEVLYEHLGRAHLNLGETDKAMLAFDKAVKISPKPLMWNNIAYDLALTKVQLDKAMQYAESAVSAVSTELRNAELSHLSSEDLSNVDSLMAYWDTLGWVYFQKGDLATAEKYTKAAWQIEITSENAYHLGQIYEKQGKKDEAIRLYALGAVADRHVPEPEEALAKLVDKTKVPGLLGSAKDELVQLQTIKLGPVFKGAKDETNAEFYVVLIPGATGNAAPADVKFISGSEKLQTLATALKSAQYDQSFPDRTATRIIRRGTLVCKDGQCRFVMKPPSDITSVD
jgi:tetratricopeptide (TPR) repeat protein